MQETLVTGKAEWSVDDLGSNELGILLLVPFGDVIVDLYHIHLIVDSVVQVVQLQGNRDRGWGWKY